MESVSTGDMEMIYDLRVAEVGGEPGFDFPMELGQFRIMKKLCIYNYIYTHKFNKGPVITPLVEIGGYSSLEVDALLLVFNIKLLSCSSCSKFADCPVPHPS